MTERKEPAPKRLHFYFSHADLEEYFTSYRRWIDNQGEAAHDEVRALLKEIATDFPPDMQPPSLADAIEDPGTAPWDDLLREAAFIRRWYIDKLLDNTGAAARDAEDEKAKAQDASAKARAAAKRPRRSRHAALRPRAIEWLRVHPITRVIDRLAAEFPDTFLPDQRTLRRWQKKMRPD